MNRLDVVIFVTIVEEKSIMKAADLLYMSPSTVGSRLKALEQELKVELLERKKGVKNIILTPKGEEFLKIAHIFISLWNECDQLKSKHDPQLISIATVDSYLEYNLIPLYREMVYGDAGYRLNLKLYPADMIYPLVSKKEVDIGFALYYQQYPDVKAVPIMSDDMVLVTPNTSPLPNALIHPQSLDASKELLVGSKENRNIGWGPEFRMWHDRWINSSIQPLVTASSISILLNFLDRGDYWMILPKTTALGYAKTHNIRILNLSPAPPKRICYKLTHRFPSENSLKNTALFEMYLEEYIRNTLQLGIGTQTHDG